jgi:hypothetical protein
MKKTTAVSAAIWLTTLTTALADEQAPKQQSLTCNIGPVVKTYGGSQWMVYSCDDAHSIVVVSAPGSPAAPFYFMFWWNGTTHQVRGEGTGDTKATDAAFADMKNLTESELAALLAETKRR